LRGGKGEVDALWRGKPGEGNTAAWKSPTPGHLDEDLACDPGGKTAGEEMFGLKRTVEAKKNDMAGIVTRNKLYNSVKRRR
jgi:hypothetical protein